MTDQKLQAPAEYGNVTDRLDTLEHRLKLLKSTMNEVIAFANQIEQKNLALEERVKDLTDVLMGNGIDRERYEALRSNLPIK